MIKEDRVKEEIRLEILHEQAGKEMETVRGFWEFDYVGRELLVSYVTGTICYALCLVIWVLAQVDELVAQLNASKLNYKNMAVSAGSYYLAFMAIYFCITILVYLIRYKRSRRTLNQYNAHMKRLNKIYAREDKQK